MITEVMVLGLIDDWIVHRDAAAALLVEQLHLESPEDVLRPENRGRHELSGTGWSYRTHGIGVDVTRTNGHGGIDFDFALDGENTFANPDWWRLCLFAKRSVHDRRRNADDYCEFVDNSTEYRAFIETVIARRFAT